MIRLELTDKEWAWVLGALRQSARILTLSDVWPAHTTVPESSVYTNAGAHPGPNTGPELNRLADRLVDQVDRQVPA